MGRFKVENEWLLTLEERHLEIQACIEKHLSIEETDECLVQAQHAKTIKLAEGKKMLLHIHGRMCETDDCPACALLREVSK